LSVTRTDLGTTAGMQALRSSRTSTDSGRDCAVRIELARRVRSPSEVAGVLTDVYAAISDIHHALTGVHTVP
jgi:hypothetical protein